MRSVGLSRAQKHVRESRGGEAKGEGSRALSLPQAAEAGDVARVAELLAQV